MYLAHHVRFGAHISMDTMTTSPVQSINNTAKKNVNSNYNLSKSIESTTGVIDKRFEDHRKLSLREENIVNRASQSATKDIIERKAQYLIDQSFVNRLNIKGMHYRKEVWLIQTIDRLLNVSQKFRLLFQTIDEINDCLFQNNELQNLQSLFSTINKINDCLF